jgi:hypothetical protein
LCHIQKINDDGDDDYDDDDDDDDADECGQSVE